MKVRAQQQRRKDLSSRNCIIRSALGFIGIFVVLLCVYELKSMQQAAGPIHSAAVHRYEPEPDNIMAYKPPKLKAKQAKQKAGAHLREEIMRNHRDAHVNNA